SHIEVRMDVVRNDADLPRQIRVESSVGLDRNGWRGTFGADLRTLTVSIDHAGAAQALPLPNDLTLPDELIGSLAPVWREGRAQIRFSYLDPSSASPVVVVAERADDSAPSQAAGVRVRMTPGNGRESRTETLWIDAQGQMNRWEYRFFGTTLVW